MPSASAIGASQREGLTLPSGSPDDGGTESSTTFAGPLDGGTAGGSVRVLAPSKVCGFCMMSPRYARESSALELQNGLWQRDFSAAAEWAELSQAATQSEKSRDDTSRINTNLGSDSAAD
jgi:hypothetical protein